MCFLVLAHVVEESTGCLVGDLLKRPVEGCFRIKAYIKRNAQQGMVFKLGVFYSNKVL